MLVTFDITGTSLPWIGCLLSDSVWQRDLKHLSVAVWCTAEISVGPVAAYCVSNNDIEVAHYNFNAHQPILVIFDRDVYERVCYRTVICYTTSPN